MHDPGGVQDATKPTTRFRKVAAGTVAVALSSVLIGFGFGSPAGAQAPAAVTQCSVDTGTPTLTGTFSGLPPNDSVFLFVVVENGNGQKRVFQGYEFGTDGDGNGGPIPPVPFGPLPLKVSGAVYRDLNANHRWDPNVDDTLYQGAGTITACPSSVTLSSK